MSILNIIESEVIESLKGRFLGQYAVLKGIPIHVSEKGTPYVTWAFKMPMSMLRSTDDVKEIFFGLTLGAIRGQKSGDVLYIRTADVSQEDEYACFFLRVCLDESGTHNCYEKKEDGYGRIDEL